MQSRTKQLIVREALMWCQYFVISSVSAVWAHDYYLSERYSLPVAGVDAIHLSGLMRDLWSGYFVPWLGAFLLLCAFRFLILFLSHQFGHTVKRDSAGSADNRAL